MTLSTTTAGALIMGAPANTRARGIAMAKRNRPVKVKIILTRSIYHLGVQCNKGQILEVDSNLASYLVAVSKAKSYNGKRKARNILLELEAGDITPATERAPSEASEAEVKRLEAQGAAEDKARAAKKKQALAEQKKAREAMPDEAVPKSGATQ